MDGGHHRAHPCRVETGVRGLQVYPLSYTLAVPAANTRPPWYAGPAAYEHRRRRPLLEHGRQRTSSSPVGWNGTFTAQLPSAVSSRHTTPCLPRATGPSDAGTAECNVGRVPPASNPRIHRFHRGRSPEASLARWTVIRANRRSALAPSPESTVADIRDSGAENLLIRDHGIRCSMAQPQVDELNALRPTPRRRSGQVVIDANRDVRTCRGDRHVVGASRCQQTMVNAEPQGGTAVRTAQFIPLAIPSGSACPGMHPRPA